MKFHARSFAFFPVNLWAKEKLLAVYSNENVLQYVLGFFFGFHSFCVSVEFWGNLIIVYYIPDNRHFLSFVSLLIVFLFLARCS